MDLLSSLSTHQVTLPLRKKNIVLSRMERCRSLKILDLITNAIWNDSTLINTKVKALQLLFDFKYTTLKKAFPQCWLDRLKYVNDLTRM